ncbi:hypothetical protein [Streptomyces sp. NPDC093149]
MNTVRHDVWIERPESAEKLTDYMGLHLVAYPMVARRRSPVAS